MNTLRLLGGCTLFDDSGAVVSRLSQRRAEAVLAVLGVMGAPGCTRDHLLGLLWPDRTNELARHSLRSALHALRSAVNPDIILTAGDDVRLNPSLIACDVTLLRAARRDGRLEEAAALYRGPFLNGFHVDEAEEFERWLDEERSRLFHEHADVLETLATRAEQACDWSGAAAWWIRAAEHDPHNSRVVIRLMRSLAAAGDRGNALLRAEAHRRRLWTDLEIEPDASFAEEVARLRSAAVNGNGAPYVAVNYAMHDVEAVPALLEPMPRAGAPSGGSLSSGAPSSGAPSNGAPLSDAPPRNVPPCGAEPRAPAGSEPPRGRSLARMGMTLVAIAAVTIGIAWQKRSVASPFDEAFLVATPYAPRDAGPRHEAPPMRDDLIAIAPTLAQHADSTLADLAVQVTGAFARALESGPRPNVAPSTDTTARFVLTSTVRREDARVRISATLRQMPDQKLKSSRSVLAAMDRVAGAADALLLQVLADWADEPEHRVEWLSRRDPRAVRQYLAESRRIHFYLTRDWTDASVRGWIGDILARDSLLVHPVLSYFYTTGAWRYIPHEPWHDTVAALTWRRRGALPREDRAYVEAVFGPWFGMADTEEARLELWRRATTAASNWWRPWFRLAAELSAFGSATTEHTWRSEAVQAFDRALALSDTARPEVNELAYWFKIVPGAIGEGASRPFGDIDTVGARALIAAAARRNAPGGGLYITARTDWIPGLVAALGDRSAEAYWTSLVTGQSPGRAVRVLTAIASAQPAAAPAADATVRAWEASPHARRPVLTHWWAGQWWRTRGKYDLWTSHFRTSLGWLPSELHPVLDNIANDQSVIASVVYLGYPWDALARSSVARLQRIAAGDSVPAPDSTVVGLAHCWLAQWRLAQGDTAGVARAIAYLRAVDRRDRAGRQDGLPGGQRWIVCPALLEAQLARVTGRRQLETARRLDSLLRPMPLPRRGFSEGVEVSARHDQTRPIENLLTARLLAAAGDTAAALAASRRYPRDIQTIVDFVYTLPEYLREEGRFAAAMGDSYGATRAYEHYLALRSERPTHPPWRAVWDSVRAELAALRPNAK